MLKICGSSVRGKATLRLAGSLAGEWVAELKRACALARVEHRQVILDFTDVVFVDRGGVALIRRLRNEGISLTNYSPFIGEQLKQISTGKDAGDT